MEATHLIKVWFVDSFPSDYGENVIKAVIIERFEFLGDKLENVEILPLLEKGVGKQAQQASQDRP